jgi:hypothetical protein
MYRRSLLVLRALTDWRSGAVIAGAREGWAYVWPRDTAATALAYAAAGEYREARRVARFLLRLDLGAAARFYPDGMPVPARAAQGDSEGWVSAAARAAGLPVPAGRDFDRRGRAATNSSAEGDPPSPDWRDRADYQEKDPGDYLGNALASARLPAGVTRRGAISTPTRYTGTLSRRVGHPGSGVDSAAAWAVRPFPHPILFPLARRSLNRLLARREGRFGIVPSQDWPGDDPWTAPTAWTAWAYAALAAFDRRGQATVAHGRRGTRLDLSRWERRQALRLIGDLRRAVTPLGLLPERVDAHTGAPRSTTPLAWSHAFAILTLHALWP